MIEIRRATRDDHEELWRIAKQSRHTRDFSHMMFSGPAMYERGWIRLAEEKGEILGFTCVRHKVRAPETKLYFIAVDEKARRRSVGTILLADLAATSPHRRIVLDVAKSNGPALRFYERHGFELVSNQALKGEGLTLRKEW